MTRDEKVKYWNPARDNIFGRLRSKYGSGYYADVETGKLLEKLLGGREYAIYLKSSFSDELPMSEHYKATLIAFDVSAWLGPSQDASRETGDRPTMSNPYPKVDLFDAAALNLFWAVF